MSKRLTLIFSLLVSGCTSDSEAPDAALMRDAATADGGGLLDAGAGVDAGGAPDAAAPRVCALMGCDPRSAAGCLDGSCSLWGESSTCEATAGSLPPGSSCTYVDECAPGLACFQTETGGVCGAICCPGDDTCCPGGPGAGCGERTLCGGTGALVDGTVTPWSQCLPPRTCDVLAPRTTCSEREGCYIIDTERNTECRVAGTAGFGDPCMVQEDCQAGFFCGGIGSATRCVRICRIGGEPCPPDEGRCVAQAHSPEGSGFCTIDTTMVQRR